MVEHSTTPPAKPKKAAPKAKPKATSTTTAKKTAATATTAAAAGATAGEASAFDFKSFADDAMNQAGQWSEQAKQAAKAAAASAKDTTGSAMHNLAKFITDTAATVDDRVGPQYGDYARNAADTIGKAADNLDAKDVDQIMDDAREFVRKSPAVAIGAAAVVGFVLMRMAKGSGKDRDKDG